MKVAPIAGTHCAVGQGFGVARSGGRTHRGIDLIETDGVALVAVVDGKIREKYPVDRAPRGGNQLMVEDRRNGTRFVYSHLSRFADGIENGVPVRAGQVIGYVGATGNASGPHLHFQVHPHGGAPVDPLPFLRAVSACGLRPDSAESTTPSVPTTSSGNVTNGTSAPAGGMNAVVFSPTRIAANDTIGIQVVGFPGLPSDAQRVTVSVRVTSANAGRAAIWPCGSRAGLNGGNPVAVSQSGATTRLTLAVGQAKRLCYVSNVNSTVSVTVHGYSR